MLTDSNFELETLKDKVAQVYGGKIKTTNDFAKLSETITETTGQRISESTLKRIWGYVNYTPQPHATTLDILSKYIGYESFRHYCNALQLTSAFFSCEKIVVSELEVGNTVRMGWAPDREILLEFLGGSSFRVADGGTSMLRQGDVVEASAFLQGVPMFFGKVVRNGEELPAYVAGKTSGLTKLELVY